LIVGSLHLLPNRGIDHQVSTFISPSDRVAQLCFPALASLFVTCDLQGYGGGILTPSHLYVRLVVYICCDIKQFDHAFSVVVLSDSISQTVSIKSLLCVSNYKI
jgi:hypothetical protein